MKLVFSITVALLLLAYPALAETCLAAPMEMTACAAGQSACCNGKSDTVQARAHAAHKSSRTTDGSNACALCTIGTGCVMIFETATAAIAPSLRAERFVNLEEFGETRFEEPLLPPPRESARQLVS